MEQATTTQLGVIGGSGVYHMEGVELVAEHDLTTPFGRPSDAVIEAKVGDQRVYFIPRHGKGHSLTPSEVNYRANIHVLKQLGVTHVLSVSAVGIMREDIHPGNLVVPDQIFDRTRGHRASTFFGEGIVGHVAFADPFCEAMRQVVLAAASHHTSKLHSGGTYVCMEGPQFSTRAESAFYRQALSPAVIGMTALPEAKLAREAEMCYALLALATDYDCWHESEDDVSVDAVVAVLQANVSLANAVVRSVAHSLAPRTTCACASAAQSAILTKPELVPNATKAKLAILYGKYLSR